ncbi:MAG TPA: hypothetical protein VIG24_12585 [Acidimicrobiia bacterium]
MNLNTDPLEPWLKPDRTWNKSDVRLWHRAKKAGHISEEAADRLCLRYARIQLELIHPDLP